MTARALLTTPRGSDFKLSGQLGIVIDGVSPYDSTNAIKVDTDGNVYEGDSTNGDAITYSQVDTATDWIRPVRNPTQYYVRYSNVSGTFTSTPGTVNTAIALTTDRTWTVNRTTAGTSSVTFDLEILDTNQTTVLAGPSAYRVEVTNTS